MLNAVAALYPVASSATLLAGYAYIFYLLDRYDWGHPFTKLLCFSALMAALAWLRHHQARPPSSSALRWETILLTALLVVNLSYAAKNFWPEMLNPVESDTGYTVQQAAAMLIGHRENPYQNQTIAVIGSNPNQWGFKYGPLMMLGYLYALADSRYGFKITNAAYLALTALILIRLSRNSRHPNMFNRTAALFALTALTLPHDLWYELFQRGVSDIFPAILILGSLLAIKNKHWWWAGLLSGLSFSTKFFPAMLLPALFIRRQPHWPFYKGFAWGITPLLPFLLWDPAALLNNIFIFHAIKDFDSTSLYSLTPASLHAIFPATQILALAAIIGRSFYRPIAHRTFTSHFLFLFLIFEITHKEVHNNHLVAIIPLLAIVFAWYRHRLPGAVRSLLKRPPAMSIAYRQQGEQ